MPNEPLYIQASALKARDIYLVEDDAEVLSLEAADQDGEDKKLKKFSISAYNGGKMNVGFGLPVVVDLSGMKVSSKSRPILKDHDPGKVVGHTDKIQISGGSIKASGVVSGSNLHAEEVVMSSANGFPWQASIGASIERHVEVARGETVQVNGRKFAGPLIVARKSTLKEISFVALGADDSTSARVAATNNNSEPETITMEFEKWLEAQGFKLEDLSDDQVKNLKATYELVTANAEQDDDGDADDAPEPKKVKAKADNDDDESFDLKAAVAEMRAEALRIGDIKEVAKDHPEIMAKAIEKEWSKERTELEVLRAARPSAPNINTGAGRVNELNEDVLTAAICMAGRLKDVEKQFDEKTLDAAHKRYRGNVGLQEVLADAANANGYVGSPSFRRDGRGILEAAFSNNPSQSIQAAGGFSGLSITGVLSNTANKFLLQGYNAVEATWSEISNIRNVSDFKQHTSYNLIGDLEYVEVGAGGTIPHGTLSDESFTNQAKTYARMLAITRQDIINDDLGALTAVPTKLGRGAALKMNKIFWTEFLDNTSFFTSGRNNLATTNSLSIGGLTAAELLFLDQKSPENADGETGSPLGIMPSILLVPNALNVTATQLMNTTQVNEQAVADSATGVPVPNSNPHAGKFRVVRSSYLSDSTLGGAQSTSTWYLLANPMDLPTIEVAALNGNTSPTVETADADFSTLGIQMRGYSDVGVNKQNYLAGVKSTA